MYWQHRPTHLLTTADVELLSRKSKGAIYKEIQRGKLVFTEKDGNRYLFSRSDVERWMGQPPPAFVDREGDISAELQRLHDGLGALNERMDAIPQGAGGPASIDSAALPPGLAEALNDLLRRIVAVEKGIANLNSPARRSR